MGKKKVNYVIDKETLLLYLLSRVEPKESTKLKINKLAFFAEFGYKFKTGKTLTDAEYAGVTHGPVINNYRDLFAKMESQKLIKINGNYLTLLEHKTSLVPSEVTEILDPILDKYSRLSVTELRSLSHQTDSYLITTKGEKVLGKIIDKDLAALETFFGPDLDDDVDENSLPIIEESKIVRYETN